MCPFLTGGSISPSRGPQILQASSPATDTAAVNAAYHTPYVYQPLKPRSVLRAVAARWSSWYIWRIAVAACGRSNTAPNFAN